MLPWSAVVNATKFWYVWSHATALLWLDYAFGNIQGVLVEILFVKSIVVSNTILAHYDICRSTIQCRFIAFWSHAGLRLKLYFLYHRNHPIHNVVYKHK